MNYNKEQIDWMKGIAGKVVPLIETSAFFTSIFTDNFVNDPKCALELGIAILMDKPLIFFVKRGTKIPKSIEKVARAILYYTDEMDFDGLKDQLAAVIKEMKVTGEI